MEPLLDSSGDHASEFLSSPLTSSSLLSTTPGREHSLDEEKLSRVLIERVLPPFSKSMKLQALVVYQADREKMNCLLVNRNYEKFNPHSPPNPVELDSDPEQPPPRSLLVPEQQQQPTVSEPMQSSSVDEVSDLSDSGYVDSTKILTTDSPVPLQPATNGLSMESNDSAESPDCGASMSRRKRKLCRPCKIPQNGSVALDSSGSVVVEDAKLPRLATTITTAPTTPAPTLFPSHPVISTTTTMTTLKTCPATSGSPNELVPFTPKTISDSVIIPVTAVTLLPRVSVFSLPVTVLSTLPRPILPRISSHDKPTITVTTIPATSMLSAASTLSQPPPFGRVTNDPGKTGGSEASTLATSTNTTATTTTTIATTGAMSDANARRFGKSFLCNQCRRDFSSLSLLCAHTFAVHRCFRCTICDAQFTQRSNLQRHSLRHVGFKPFVCKVCDKAYYRKDHLVRHIELSHPGRDPRLSLTVKLSSAECLEYLERLQAEGTDVEQVQMLCQAPDEPSTDPKSPLNGTGSTEESELVVETSPEQKIEAETR